MALEPQYIPRAQSSIINPDGTATIEFRNFLLRVVNNSSSASSGAAMEQRIDVIERRITALQDDSSSTNNLNGYFSVKISGSTVTLVNDVANPGGSQYYGTSPSGVRGWYNLTAVQSVVAGSGISVDATDPKNPIVSRTDPTVTSNVSRTLGTNYTISTRPSMVYYTIRLDVTNPLVAGTSEAVAYLEYSTDGGSSWVTVSTVLNHAQVGVGVAIALNDISEQVLTGCIPGGALVRIRTSTVGGAFVTYIRGQEVVL